MILDGRQRGAKRRTPWVLRKLGWPPYRRPIYADWRIGGGWDGWEYSDGRAWARSVGAGNVDVEEQP